MSFQIISKFISRGFWDRNQILNADSFLYLPSDAFGYNSHTQPLTS